jgi:class 3 adenylate cyclase
MNKTEKAHKEILNPYNIKILRNFVLYFKEKLGWSHTQIEELFTAAGLPIAYLDADDNWFDQEIADKFYNLAVQRSGDKDLAFKVGAYTVNAFSAGIGGLLIQGAFSARFAYKNIQRIAGVYTKGSYYEAVSISSEEASIRSRVKEWCNEKPYQCENRLGMLASIPLAFGAYGVESEHPICFHKGQDYCEYKLKWKEPLRARPIPIAALTAVTGLLISYLSTSNLLLSSAVFSNLFIAVFMIMRELMMGAMKKTLAEQNNALEESVQVMSRRRDEQALLQEVIKTTTQMMPIKDLSRLTTELVKREMLYDRVVVALVDKQSRKLKIHASSGFNEEITDLLENSEFNIRPDNSAGLFVKVVNTNSPVFEPDVSRSLPLMSPRTRELVQKLGSKSLIVVPISFKGEVLGVLSVDNILEGKPLGTNDMELLASLADHLSVAFSNSMSFEAKVQALEMAQKMEQKQRETKEIFQKYVPTEIVERQEEISETDLTFLNKKDLSIMFVDMVGFTAFSEKNSAERVVEVLNIYIEEINEIVIRNNGKINKVIGDGLLAYFDPALENTLKTGYEILENLPRINSCLNQKGFGSIQIAIGCHRGICTLGSIGYGKRLDYTLIGDPVNTAARIETLTRRWGTNILCFSSALLKEASTFETLHRGSTELKGKNTQVEVYQLLSRKTSQQAA